MEIVAAGEDGKREFCTAFWLRGAVWAGWSVRTKDHCPTPTPSPLVSEPHDPARQAALRSRGNHPMSPYGTSNATRTGLEGVCPVLTALILGKIEATGSVRTGPLSG